MAGTVVSFSSSEESEDEESESESDALSAALTSLFSVLHDQVIYLLGFAR